MLFSFGTHRKGLSCNIEHKRFLGLRIPITQYCQLGSNWVVVHVSRTMSRSVVDIGTTAGANLADAHGNRVCCHLSRFLGFGTSTSTLVVTAIIDQYAILLITGVMFTFNGSSDAKSVYFLVFMFSCKNGNEQKKNESGLKIRYASLSSKTRQSLLAKVPRTETALPRCTATVRR